MFTRFLLSAVFAVLQIQMAASQSPVLIVDDAERTFPVLNSLEVFIDTTNQIAFKDIERFYNEGSFWKPAEDVPNFTGVVGKIWFRINIRNLIDEQLYLIFPEIFIEEITIHFRHTSGDWYSSSTGYLHPFESRALPFNRYTFKIPADTGEPNILFGAISVQSMQPLRLNASLGSVKATTHESRKSEFISMAVLGFSLILLLYNFGISLVIKDTLFFYFSLYIISTALLISWFTGFSFEWFWPNSPALNPYPWALALFYFVQLWFVNKLLMIRYHLPTLYKFSYAISLLSICMAIGAMMPVGFHWILSTIISIASPVYFIICASTLVYRKIKIAYIFLAGWIPLLCVTLSSMLMVADILPYHDGFDTHAIELALAWELVFFSLVLGYRYNSIRDEKFMIENENIRIINDQKALLRKMVFEQTEEIMAQNEQLVQNQEEIKAQNERLEIQNRAYERLKELILKQNHELESAVQRRTLQLAQSHEELKKHLHQVEQFSFISAHNLRAPVARILGLTSILDRTKVIGKENLSVLDRIVGSAKDLDMIIHDLGAILDTQKNTSEKIELIDIRELLDKVLSRFEAAVGNEGIRIAINAEAKHIMAVPVYMDSILSNLISNSIKYRAEQKSPWIRITTEELPSAWRILVEDNGLGFDSTLMSRKLFEPFQRFHTHKEGKGLGMFLVKTQVVAMQGTIELHSQPNKGTQVSMIIPKMRLQRTA